MCDLKSFRRLFKLSLQAIKEKFSADMIETRKRTASVCRLRDQELRQFQNNLKMISEHNSQVMYLHCMLEMIIVTPFLAGSSGEKFRRAIVSSKRN